MQSLSTQWLEALVLVATSYGGGSVHGSGQASAVVIEPLSVTPQRPLDFGLIGPGEYGPTVVKATDEVGKNGAGPARFLVRGGALRNYRVTPEPMVMAIGRKTKFEIAVTEMTVATDNILSYDMVGRLDGLGFDRVSIGGTINVPEGTPADRFVADVVILVEYE